jgi:hypothetical protein
MNKCKWLGCEEEGCKPLARQFTSCYGPFAKPFQSCTQDDHDRIRAAAQKRARELLETANRLDDVAILFAKSYYAKERAILESAAAQLRQLAES